MAFLRRVPVPVRWLCALNLCLLAAFSLLAPTWRAPDEPNHADLVVALRDHWHYPAHDGRDVDPGIRASFSWVRLERSSAHLRVEEALPRAERPSREELRAEGAAVDLGLIGRPGVANHMSQHPPGYYLVMAVLAEGVDRVLPGDGLGPYDREVAVLRLLSLLAAVPLPLVAWWVASVVGVARSAAVAAAVGTLGVPQLTHISSVVNNDGLTVLLFGLVTGLLVKVGRGDLAARTVVPLGAATGALFFVKGTAFVLPLWTAAALVLAGVRLGRAGRLRPVLAARRTWLLGAAYAVPVALGGWWWLANQLAYGHYSPSIELSTRLTYALVRPPGFEPSFADWFGQWAGPVLRRYWGDFGWVDVAMPQPAVLLATLFVLTGVALVLRYGASSPGLGTVGLLALPTVLLTVFFGWKGYSLYRIGGVMAGVQGRYMFGGVVGLMVLAAAGWHHLAHRWTPLVFLTAATALQAVAVTAMLTRWWGPERASPRERLAALVAWSPWPAGALAAAALAAAAVALLTVHSFLVETANDA